MIAEPEVALSPFSTKLISLTPDAERTMVFCARVSSPDQDNPKFAGLLKYCIRKGHWSVFEHAYMTIEIVTSRAITQQIIRHRSFTFQEFSQRYAEATKGVIYEARGQAKKNRQSSIDNVSDADKVWWAAQQRHVWGYASRIYQQALKRGIAKECARIVLPVSTQSTIYMTGSVRSWIHYLQSRTKKEVQLEHREIAESIREIFVEQFPIIAEALEWKK